MFFLYIQEANIINFHLRKQMKLKKLQLYVIYYINLCYVCLHTYLYIRNRDMMNFISLFLKKK